jgi:hypothetical protein
MRTQRPCSGGSGRRANTPPSPPRDARAPANLAATAVTAAATAAAAAAHPETQHRWEQRGIFEEGATLPATTLRRPRQERNAAAGR